MHKSCFTVHYSTGSPKVVKGTHFLSYDPGEICIPYFRFPFLTISGGGGWKKRFCQNKAEVLDESRVKVQFVELKESGMLLII